MENFLSLFEELKDQLGTDQYELLRNTAPSQWPLVIKLIKDTEEYRNKIEMHLKEIDVIRRMEWQYNEIIEKQMNELAKLNADSND